MANTTVTISIGRVIGNKPMSDKQWRKFIHLVGEVVKATADKDSLWVNSAKSRNDWEGTPEESRTWVFDTELGNLERIDNALAVLRIDFRQEAIARTSGQTRLIGIN